MGRKSDRWVGAILSCLPPYLSAYLLSSHPADDHLSITQVQFLPSIPDAAYGLLNNLCTYQPYYLYLLYLNSNSYRTPYPSIWPNYP